MPVPSTAAALGAGQHREQYDPVQKGFHWGMAVIVVAAVALGLWSSFLVPGTPLRRELLDVHKSLGMTAFLLVIPRLVYRVLSQRPAELPNTSRAAQFAATGVHLLLYSLMVLMPVAGYLFSAAGGYSLPWFGLFDWPRLVPHNAALAHSGQTVHDWGAWVVYAALSIHVAAVFWHEIVPGESALARMLPGWPRWRSGSVNHKRGSAVLRTGRLERDLDHPR